MQEIVQGLWIGDTLSAMERLSIASFLRHGYRFHLYTYGEVAGVPPGTEVRDAATVLPASRIFFYPQEKFYGAFANLFRYKLLLAEGGWWADVDMVCLAPFDFPTAYVFASEPAPEGAVPTNGLLRVPAGSAIMEEACAICEGKDPERLSWGETGSKLLRELLGRHGLEDCVQRPEVFCPIPYDRWEEALDPQAWRELPAPARGVHLWRQMWRRAGIDTDAPPPPGSLYARLQARYLSGER